MHDFQILDQIAKARIWKVIKIGHSKPCNTSRKFNIFRGLIN
jgi:hypothetical protein